MKEHKHLAEARAKMDKSQKLLLDQFVAIRGYMTPGIVDTVRVQYHGSSTPLNQVAQMTIPQPDKMIIKPHDQSLLKDIERAIHAANLGFGVFADKNGVHLTMPRLSGEQKEKMVHHVKKLGEDAKVAIRNVRHAAKKDIDKDKGLSEDESKKLSKGLQDITDGHILKVQEVVDNKVKAIMK